MKAIHKKAIDQCIDHIAKIDTLILFAGLQDVLSKLDIEENKQNMVLSVFKNWSSDISHKNKTAAIEWLSALREEI